ncbi:hypothetical protein C7U61_14755 [Rhizobium sp. JAB6]|uniref:hypothetical protein n=1 Tax=Rhizobium sp. JAB6 TaxID=2127050 RepID=UPI000D12A255|nr:hypothetical protein [Rhizobium sp. JAB6]PST19747.1 hypothetical protein C7U61_14755 [Rhizobium sp. JAB6]
MLTDLIARYTDAKKVWEAQFEHDCASATTSPEWAAYMSLTGEILGYCCLSREEHFRKIELIESDANLFEELVDRSDNHGALLFLRSLKGGAFYGAGPVDNGEN